MRDTTTTEQARAVFLAAIVVISMVGVGFAGTAAAEATDLTLDDADVQSGVDVSGNVTDDDDGGENITVFIDEDDSGTLKTGESNVTLTPTNGTQIFNGLSTEGLEEGKYTVNATQDGVSVTKTLTVDNTTPSYNDASPTGDVADNSGNFSVNITDKSVGVNASSISVSVNDSEGTLLNNAGTGSENVDYDNEETQADELVVSGLTYAEGPVSVNVSAADNADNVEESSFEFTVDSQPSLESISVDETPINTSNNDDQTRNVTVVFSEDMASVDTVEFSNFPGVSTSSSDITVSGDLNGDTWVGSFSAEADTNADENMTISVDATDDETNGYTVNDSSEFIVDTQPPSVTANTSDTISGDTYNVSQEFEFQNVGGDTEVTYEYDAGSGWEEVGTVAGTDMQTFNTSNVSDGNIDLRATAVDDAGNEDSDTGSTVVDNNAPTVSTNLSENEVLTSTVDLSTRFTAENVDGNEVTYFVDEGADGNFSSVSASFDTGTIADGSAVLKANASDDAGTEDSASETVVVDNTAPDNLTIDSPSDQVFQNVGNFDLNYSYTEVNPDEEQIVFSADGEEDVVFNFTGVGGNEDIERNRTLDLTSPDDGNITNATYDVSVEVTDLTGEQSDSTTETDLVTVDDIEPGDINIVEPSEEQIVESDDVLTVAYNYVEDNTESVTVTLDGPEERTYDIDDSQYQNDGIRKTVNLDLDEEGDLQDGSYDVTVNVTDAAGNHNESTTDEPYVVVNDDAPTVSTDSLDPSEDVAPDASVDVDYTVTDSVNTSEVRVWVFETNDDGEFYNATSEEFLTDYGIYSYDVDQAPSSYTEAVNLSVAPDEATEDFSVTDNDNYEVVVMAVDETGKTGVDLTNSATLDVNENAPNVTDVQADAGTDTVTVEFSEALGNDEVDETDFAYQDVSNSSATEVTGADLSDDGMSVELTLDSAVEADELGNDTVSVTQNSLYDTHPHDERYVSSGEDYALDDDEVSVPDVDVEGPVVIENEEDYFVTVYGDENLDFEVEAVGSNGTTVTQNGSVAAADGSSTADLNLSELEDGDVNMTVTVTDEADNTVSTDTLKQPKDTDAPGIESAAADEGYNLIEVTFDKSVQNPTADDFDFSFTAEAKEVVTDEDEDNTYWVVLDSDVPRGAFADNATVSAPGVQDDLGNAFDGEAVEFSDNNEPSILSANTENGSDTVEVKFLENVYGANGSAVTAENLTYEGDNEIVEVEHTAGDNVATVHLNESVSGDDIGTDAIAASETPFVDVADKEGFGSAPLSHELSISEYEATAENGTVTVSFDASNDLNATEIAVERNNPMVSLEGDSYEDTVATTLTLDDFEEENGTYTASFDAPRDGEYLLRMVSVEDVAGNTDQYVDNDDVTVDDETVSPDEAIINNVGGDDESAKTTDIRVTFTEPVDASAVTPDDVSIDGVADEDILTVTDAGAQGAIHVYVDGDVNTGDAPDVTVDGDSYTSLASASETGAESGSATVLTDRLHLTEGTNFVSVPAAAGSLSLSEVDTSDVNAIWAYDAAAEEWQSYDPEASENDLDALEGGVGYVVVMDDGTSATWDVNVHNVPGEAENVENSVPNSNDLTEGWNLIGHYQEHDQTVQNGLSSMSLENNEPYRLYAQADGSATMEYQSFQAGDFSTMERGEAYWVFVQDDETYTEAPIQA